jgi:hypothetical protein
MSERLIEELMMVVARNRMVRWGYDKTLDESEKEGWLRERMKDTILRTDLVAILEYLDHFTPGMPDPCQPIGCDNGYHIAGCVFEEVDGGQNEERGLSG